MAEGEEDPAGEAAEEEVPKETVPEVLNLPLFWQNDRLSDCLIKLPPEEKDAEGGSDEKNADAAPADPPAEGGEEGGDGETADDGKTKRAWRCHKVILCAASDFFYEKFIIGGGAGGGAAAGGEEGAAEGEAQDGGAPAGDELETPSLPNDPIVRKELDLTEAVPLALRYCYCNQQWEDIEPDIVDPVALFAAATLLKINTLKARCLEHLEKNVLSRRTCTTLFYHATLLGSAASELCEMARQFLLGEFCYLTAEDHAKLMRLPMSSLLPLLEDDDLLVQDEGEVYSLVNKVLRTRLPRQEQILALGGIKLSEAQYFVNQPALFELVVVESGTAMCDGVFYPPETERYSARTTARLTIEPGTKGEFSFPEEEGYALSLTMPSLYNTNVSALQPPDIVIRALKEILPADADASDEVAQDPKLRYEVLAEGILPRDAYVKQPASPSMRRKLGLPAMDATTKSAKAGEETTNPADEGGEGGAGEGGEEAEESVVYSVPLKFKDDARGEMLFTVTVSSPEKDGEKEGGEGEGEEGAAPAEAEKENAGGEENAEGGEAEATGEPEVKAGLPLDDVDVDALLDAVRFPYLQHQTLVDASREPVLHEATAQHLVVEALSARLSAYEPGGVIGDKKPRNSLMRALVPVSRRKGSAGSMQALQDPRSPLKTMKIEQKLAAPSTGIASLETPFHFGYERDFDDNGLLHFLATNGKRSAWKNPQGLGQVQVLKSGVGFGKSEDLVGREALNLRTANTENSFFGVDLQGDRLFVCTGYCLRGRNTTSHALMSWQLQGSRDPSDPNKWQVIDDRYKSPAMLGKPGITAFFECTAAVIGSDAEGMPNAACRAFRVVQLGKNSSGSYNLGLSGIELYGKGLRGSYP
ncbi:unnamed protein product [Amoebophrya sp. A25]|nr:unnamed protein product [Amoebophrya sp. A25]|eukprot:GSA25T00013886001.1